LEECNCYDKIIVDKLREGSKYEMKRIHKKYRLNYKLIRVIVDLEFNPDLYYSVKVSRLMHDYNFHRD